MLNGGLDGLKPACESRRREVVVQRLLQKIHYALDGVIDRFVTIAPGRLPELSVLKVLFDQKQVLQYLNHQTVYFNCLQEALPDVVVLGEPDAYQELKKTLQFYHYQLVIAREGICSQTVEPMQTMSVGGMTLLVGDPFREPLESLQASDATLAAGVVKQRLSARNETGLKPYCKILVESCRQPPRTEPRNLFIDTILRELSPSEIYGNNKAEAHPWSLERVPTAITRRQGFDAPLLHYPAYPEYNLWADLLEMHEACLEREYDDLALRHFTQLALLFVKPQWRYYRRLFFCPDRNPYSNPHDRNEYYDVAGPWGKLLLPLLEKVVDEVLYGHENNFKNYSVLAKDPLLKMRQAGYDFENQPVYLFVQFIKAMMRTAHLYRTQAHRDAIQIIEPVYEVVKQGYLPGVDIIDDMLKPASGLFDESARERAEKHFSDLWPLIKTRIVCGDSATDKPFVLLQKENSKLVDQLSTLLSSHTYMGEEFSVENISPQANYDHYSLLCPSDHGYMEAQDLSQLCEGKFSPKRNLSAYTFDQVAYGMLHLLLDKPEKVIISQGKKLVTIQHPAKSDRSNSSWL